MGNRLSRSLAAGLAIVALGGTLPTTAVRAAGPQTFTFTAPTPGAPSAFAWTGSTLDSPVAAGSISKAALAMACDGKLCEDTRLVVPAGLATSTLYVKVAWQHPVWQLYMYIVKPDGTVWEPSAGAVSGGNYGCDVSAVEKGCGNQTSQPFDEVTIPNPVAGTWTVRVAAVNFHNETYTGEASLTNSAPVAYLKQNLAQLTTHLTRGQRVNVVFAGWTPTAADINDLAANLAPQYQPAVAAKQGGDCGDASDQAGSGLVQGMTCHYTGTGSTPSTAAGAAVPYFEPVSFNFDYHYLVAADTYTKDLFAQIQADTAQGVAYSTGSIPQTSEQAPFKSAYLSSYNSKSGQYRAADKGNDTSYTVTDTSTVDQVDAYKVEDWVQGSRNDPKYSAAFTDVVTHATTGAQFINPDPGAVHDPTWNNNGQGSINVNRDPQGANTGLTFFLLDTWDPAYASTYFRPSHYHTWSTTGNITDPDTGGVSPIDNGRGWGGRYRFYMLDLGAAPSLYERSNWLTSTVNPEDGNAFFDPPLWQWHQDPSWNGTDPAQSSISQAVNGGGFAPLHYAGETLGTVLGYEVTTGLAFKIVGSFLYRPIPADVYQLDTMQVIDHYSLPATAGGQDLYSVNLDKVDDPNKSLSNISYAAPYTTFSGAGLRHLTLGCAQYRFVANSNGIGGHQVADPTCTNPDGLQQAIEDGKANGAAYASSAGGVPDYAVDPDYIRNYVDQHRDLYAPLADGAFSVPIFNVMFEKSFVVALPAIVGGIASGVNGGEGWGQIDNVNDSLVPLAAIDCSQSTPGAPGCTPAPDIFRHNYYLTYTVTHESSHFLGLNHPHDGVTIPGKDSSGHWGYEYSVLKWLYDITASPTTYAGTITQYEDMDQMRLMFGHAAEYLRQQQDLIADAYWLDGAAGGGGASQNTSSREAAMTQYRDLGECLFADGDYLHAQYADRNGALYARGIGGTQVAPHRMTVSDAATYTNALFSITPDALYNPNGGGSRATCTVAAAPTILGTPTVFPVTPPANVPDLPFAPLAILTGAAVAAMAPRLRRRRATAAAGRRAPSA